MITSENLFELVSMYSSDLDKETVEFMDLLVNKKYQSLMISMMVISYSLFDDPRGWF